MVEARLKSSFWMRVVLLGVISFGLGSLFLWFVSRGYVATLDEDGVTTRAGARHAWRDLRETRPTYVVRGRAFLDHVSLVFSSGNAGVFHQMFENGNEVLDFVRRKTGQPIPLTR